MTTNNLNTVGLFHVGPQKSGTTWIYRCPRHNAAGLGHEAIRVAGRWLFTQASSPPQVG